MKSALLIIDIQNDYFENGSNTLCGADEACQNAHILLEFFRKKGMPVIHIQHESTRPSATFFIPGTSGFQIHEKVQPLEHENVIVKHSPNSFYETELLDCLMQLSVDQLVICGMMTHMCVDSTTRAAKDFGFECIVIGDACATKDLEIDGYTVQAKDVQAALLAALNYYYSKVLTTAQYVQK